VFPSTRSCFEQDPEAADFSPLEMQRNVLISSLPKAWRIPDLWDEALQKSKLTRYTKIPPT